MVCLCNFFHRTICLILAVGLFVSGMPPSSIAQVDTDIWDTRVFVADRCPTEPPREAVTTIAPFVLAALSFLIPKAIDFGLSFVDKHLQEKKQEEEKKNEERSTSAVGTYRAFYEFREHQVQPNVVKPVVDPQLKDRCLVVLRGNFGKPTAVPGNDCQQFKQTKFREASTCKWLQDNGVYGSSNPASGSIGFYLEAKFVFSDEGTAFRLEPFYFVYSTPLTPNEGANGKYDLTFNVTLESASTGQTVVPFALAILPFQQLKLTTVFSEEALKGKSSGWASIPPIVEPHLSELKRVNDLYDSRDELRAKRDQIAAQLPRMEEKIRKLQAEANETPAPTPTLPAEPTNPFKDGQSTAANLVGGERFDDILVSSTFDSKPETATDPAASAIEAAKRRVVRQKEARVIQSHRTKVNELRVLSEEGSKLLSDQKKAASDLAKVDADIAKWKSTKHFIGPLTIRLTIKEQPYLPKNLFLLTAAEVFAASKQDISTFISQSAIQGLGLESRDVQIGKVQTQAQLLISAMGSLNAARDAQLDLDALALDAPDSLRRQKQLALEAARINANVAYLKAGMTPPYPDSFGSRL